MQSVASMIASWVRMRLSLGQISTQMLQRLHHSSTHRMLTKSTIVGARRGRLSAVYGAVVLILQSLGDGSVGPPVR